MHGQMRNSFKILIGKPEGRRPQGRPRHRWIISKWILGKEGCRVLTGSIWLRIGIGGELF
jgi:hypothetical protein